MTKVYGGCVEPGGMELDDEAYSIECSECGRNAKRHDWESAEGGCINSYWSERCAHCGYADGNSDSGLEDDFDLPWHELDSIGGSDEEEDPATAVSGPGSAEWVTPADLMALAKGQPCQVKP